jgi:preprotein translocase subunit Sec61beta
MSAFSFLQNYLSLINIPNIEGNNIAKKDKVYMPMGTGGLLRYGEEEKELIKIKPKQVIAAVAVIVVIEILLKIFLV